MTVCKHCFIDSETVSAQTRMIEALEHRIADVQKLERADIPTPPGLTASEHRIFALLLIRDTVTKEEAWSQVEHIKEDSHIKGLDVIMSRLRSKLRDMGLELETVRALGYRLPRAQRETIKQQLAAA